ncbi:LIP-domain-containing protein [Piedraia hortae CBS 480.64]|uniref:LIP-domain-containing protein n=1 Tax=Piedraia hortae CBS 480.64 TaxID=1314780 RepID=A0A6A7BYU1_9PEZI|nr:LIP-domain-containing protein [Piedraia hortae CBS 480.64]
MLRVISLLALNLGLTLGALFPAFDPFYTPPIGYEAKPPGTVLKCRPIIPSFLGFIVNAVEGHQILYRTTAIDGSAIATVTTVLKPLTKAKTDRFISFQTAYDSSASRCNPSYTYQLGSLPTSDLITELESILIQAYVMSGFIVVSPDYEGPDAAFGAGRLAGTCVLDSMRAVINYGSTLELTTKNPAIVATGYSGGAIATGWAASLQPKYAPELNIKGWAMGGTPANLTGTAMHIDNTPWTGFLPPALFGLTRPSAYGKEIEPILDDAAQFEGKLAMQFVSRNCALENVNKFKLKSIFSTNFQKFGTGLFYQPEIAKVMGDNIMGVKADEMPTAPVYMYHAPDDEVIPYTNASETFNSWCKNGITGTFNTVKNGGHGSTEIVHFPATFKWCVGAFERNATLASRSNSTSGCQHLSSTNSLTDPMELGLNLEPLMSKLITAQHIMGEKDANCRDNPNALMQPIL